MKAQIKNSDFAKNKKKEVEFHFGRNQETKLNGNNAGTQYTPFNYDCLELYRQSSNYSILFINVFAVEDKKHRKLRCTSSFK